MSVRVDFVKGHCGWDVVTLVPEGQLPAGQELAAAIKIVTAPLDGGLEAGIMGRGERDDEITLRMVSSTAKDWIVMCGGMTQVIGKALVETFLRDRFDVDVSGPVVERTLLTPAGRIPIRVDVSDGVATSVTTGMDHYVGYLYEKGIESWTLRGVPVLRTGDYAVMDVVALEQAHPGLDFTRRDPGPHLDVVNDVLREFAARLGKRGINGMMVDARPEGPGQFRVFPRFYSDDLAAARLPWEFQCGTGSIAVAVALAHQSRLPFADGAGEVLFEWGSPRTTPDPYGIRISRLGLELDQGRVAGARFTHSVVEILTEGRLALPGF
jgi:hypothetical protein